MTADRILEVWRLLWPGQMPEGEYEKALMMARLVNVAGSASLNGSASASHITVGPPAPDELVSTTEAGKLLGISAGGVQYLVRTGALKSTRDGRRYLVRRVDLEAHRPRLLRRKRVAMGVSAPGEFLSVQQAAKILGIGQDTVCIWIKAGKLKAERKGTGKRSPWRIDAADVEALKASNAPPPHDAGSAQ